jgi:hypothetical protein
LDLQEEYQLITVRLAVVEVLAVLEALQMVVLLTFGLTASDAVVVVVVLETKEIGLVVQVEALAILVEMRAVELEITV